MWKSRIISRFVNPIFFLTVISVLKYMKADMRLKVMEYGDKGGNKRDTQ